MNKKGHAQDGGTPLTHDELRRSSRALALGPARGGRHRGAGLALPRARLAALLRSGGGGGGGVRTGILRVAANIANSVSEAAAARAEALALRAAELEVEAQQRALEGLCADAAPAARPTAELGVLCGRACGCAHPRSRRGVRARLPGGKPRSARSRST